MSAEPTKGKLDLKFYQKSMKNHGFLSFGKGGALLSKPTCILEM